MSEITAGQRLDLLAEIRLLLPDAEFSAEESWDGHDIDFKDSCGCYSDYTTESCSFNVFIVGSFPEGEKNQHALRHAVESRVERWAKSSLSWSGCDCCDDHLFVNVSIYAKKAEGK